MSNKLLLHGKGVRRTAAINRQALTKELTIGGRQTITVSFAGLSSSHRYITEIPQIDQQINERDAQPARLEITGTWTRDGDQHVNALRPEIVLCLQGGAKTSSLQIIQAQIVLERRGVTVFLTW